MNCDFLHKEVMLNFIGNGNEFIFSSIQQVMNI